MWKAIKRHYSTRLANGLVMAFNAVLMAVALVLIVVASQKIKDATAQAQGHAVVKVQKEFDI